MATIKGVAKNKWYLQIDYSSTQDVSKNQSTITMTLKVYDGTGYSQNEDYHSAYYIIQGEKRWNPYNYSSTGLKTLGSKTVTVSHNQDGTGSVTLSGSWDCGFASDYTPRTLTVSGKVTLPTIPRASSVTCPSTNIGSTATISISRASSSFTHTLQYKMSDESSWTNIVTKTTSTSYSWTVPTSFYSKIPNNKSIAGKINCITYSGTTKVGEKTCDFTATVNESTNKPTITYSIDNASDSETRALTGNADTFISNFSTAYYSIVATPKNSAKITEVQIVCGDKKSTSTYSSDGAVTKDGSFSNVTSASFTINVKDSRGYTVSTTITKTLVNYVAPTCILSVDTFTAAKATLSIKGSCFNSKFGSSGQQNSISLQYRYKESGGSYSGWANVTPTYSGNTYSASQDITGLDYKKTYVFQARVNDLAKTTYIESQEITKSGTPVFDWDKDDFAFHVPVKCDGGNITFNTNGISSPRNVLFYNSDGSYPHNCGLYGGNPTSTIGIGLRDNANGREVMSYNDTENKITIGSSGSDTSVMGSLTLGGHTTPVGSILYSDSSSVTKTVASNTLVNLTSLTIPAGVWIVIGGFYSGQPSSATASGRVRISLASSSTVNDYFNPANNNGYGTNTYSTYGSTLALCGEVIAIRTGTSSYTVYLNAYQSTDSSLSITGRIKAIRIV